MKKGSLPSIKEAKDILKKAGKYVGYGLLVGAIAATVGCKKINPEKYDSPAKVSQGVTETYLDTSNTPQYIGEPGKIEEGQYAILKDGTELTYIPSSYDKEFGKREQIIVKNPDGETEMYAKIENSPYMKDTIEYGRAEGSKNKKSMPSKKQIEATYKELRSNFD